MTRVTLKGINKIFPGRDGHPGAHAVRDLDITLEDGTLVTLLGPSGCGKTTSLRMLAGFETPTSGQILIDGRDITHVPVNQRGIGMVFQSYALFPHMTVAENVAFGLEVLDLTRAEITRRVGEVLELMDLSALAGRAPAQLSGGQQQRVALARTVVTEPDVLLFDEPLSNLDAQLRERMRDELRLVQQRLGITSLYVTHDQSEAMAISDRVIVMRDGRVEQDGPPAEVYAHPRTAFVAGFMGRANILPARVLATEGESLRAELGGVPVTLPRPGSELAPGDAIRVVLRPEQIALSTSGPIRARIERVIFQGGFTEYQLKAGAALWTITDHRHHLHPGHRPGDEIGIDIGSAAAWILPGATD